MRLKKVPRFVVLTLGYTVLVQIAYLLSLWLRFEGDVPARYWDGYLQVAPWFTLLSLAGYFLAGLYHGLWRYASTVTLFQVFKGVTLSAAALVGILVFVPELLFPRSLVVMVWLWELVLLGGARFAWRISRERVLGPVPHRALRTIVVGADHTGVHLVQEMRRAPEEGPEVLNPVGFIDDDQRLTGHLVEGVRVWGTIADLPAVLEEQRVEMVIVSDADMPAKVVREIARFCAEANVRVKTLPGLSDLQHGRPALAQMRDMRIEDLLGRQPVHLNLGELAEFLRGQHVLVTGAGGSIGSELVRQVAGFAPASLVLLDHAENGLYFIHNEIAAAHPELSLHPLVADIKDHAGLELAFRRFKPSVVFHAAAHKHVPLLEVSPREAVLNNVVGTRNLAELADRFGVVKFVLISTDKAVNPTSVMGASKRVCEMLLQARAARSRTRYVAVRFGNVLGSDGSVIPLFQKQIARGGPITVTHPEARRYFMTIPEAVRLVLQAGAMGRGGEVFLLDMGEQVRIVDLARQLIRMQGLREGDDIEIQFTGLRPGEKLYEELHSDTERTRITRHERILVWELHAKEESLLLGEVSDLERLAVDGDPESVKRQLHVIVPEYVEPRFDGAAAPVRADAEPVVELPGIAGERPARDRIANWGERLVAWAHSAAAILLLVVASPLWLLLWFEARRTGRDLYVAESRIGRSRRLGQRRRGRANPAIDRRSIERRTQDLLGQRIQCLRFAPDNGPVSRYVRRRRLDALPYLLNVLRGEMALVGPRAESEDLALRCRGVIPDYERRFRVLPGVTGLAQLAGCPDDTPECIRRRVHYDLHYVEHRSWVLDVRTLFRTAAEVFRRERSHPPVRTEAPAEAEVEAASAVKGVTR